MPMRCASSSSSSTANNATNKLSTTAAATTSSKGEGVAGVAGKVFFSSLCIITFTLGIWQTKRYNEKVSMVQKREHDLKLDPISNYHDWQQQLLKQQQQQNEKNKNHGNVNVHNDKSYRRVQLTGRYIHTKQILIGPRGPPPGALSDSGPNSGRGGGGGGMASSIQGYWVITPFVIVNDNADGTTQAESDGIVDDLDTTRETKRGWFGRLLWGNNHNDKKSETSTTAQQQQQQSMNNIPNNKQEDIVWINRGWIPHHYINTKNNNEIIKSWYEPTNVVQLMTMESNTETPGMFSPPSRIDYTTTTKERNNDQPSRTINKLLWMDRTVMEELLCTTATDSSSSSSSSCINENHPPLFVEINAINDDEKTQQQQLQYPVKPTQEYVGEFKVTPEVHAGYAVTWFGLSGAGIVMTRKLLTRGR